MDVTQLADLQKLAKAQFDRDATELRTSVAAETRLQAALDAIAESEARRAEALTGDLAVAFAQTGEALWQTWAEARRRELLMALANQRAVTETIKQRARASFGRHSALGALETKLRKEALEEAARQETERLVELEVHKRWMTPPGD
ncbi:hypothetical protein [Marinovum sp.]|uniref:hypothetical protein n=1 Tax=Marinovum sp. TaxID=2024839 RepID=UPI003A91376D